MPDQNVFAGAFVDRVGERRKDDQWLEDALDQDSSVFLPVFEDRCLVSEGACALLPPDIARPHVDPDTLVFLGLFRQRPTFVFEVTDESLFADRGEYADLRSIGKELPPEEANLAAHARALILWHSTQQFCGRCGKPSFVCQGGNARRCSGCETMLFPRVDPAVIILVHRGDECLLGRQPSWPEGVYSTVAGFVEPGESLEDAVRREVFEETNIRVGRVDYHSSQPWPFPSSLMLGFVAEAVSEDIALNDCELEDARWFTRADLRSGFPKLPSSVSIARRLVDAWLEAGK